MANPVENTQAAAVPRQEEQQVTPPAPGGIGATPTTVGSAQPQKELGYIETAVNWVKGWISWAFKKVFFCWFSEPPPPVQPPAPPAINPPQLDERILEEVALLDALDRLTDRQKECVYHRIGIQATHFYYPGQWLRSYEEIGKREVKKNPLILQCYLLFGQE